MSYINYARGAPVRVQTVNSGTGFCGLLTIAFIILKLTGFINWSWVWVLSPLWIPISIILAIFAFFAFVILGLTFVSSLRFRKA